MITDALPATAHSRSDAPLLRIDGLAVTTDGCDAPLLGPLDLQLHAGECVGLIGESGSGKSLTVLSLMGLLPPGLRASGRLAFNGESMTLLSSSHRALRGRGIAWMPQDPQASLHPLRRVGSQLIETLRVLRGIDNAAAAHEARRLFTELDLPDPASLLSRYPHQLSGGQRQRVGLALALAGNPRLLLADEPTSALDPRLADEILGLLDRLRAQRGLGLLLVSHDLPLVGRHAQRLLILQRGRVVESGDATQLFAAPTQDYTRELLAADRLPAPEPASPGACVLDVSGLVVRYPRTLQPAVRQVDFALHRGECLALVGASGSGKSSLGRALLRLLRQGVEGRVFFEGEDLLLAGRDRLRALRGRLGVVFQDPYASLDPRMRVIDIVAEPLRVHEALGADACRNRVLTALAEVGMQADLASRYPHQFSGGQRQRIAIARALVRRPSLLVCDEAVSALDARHRADILALLAGLKKSHGLAMLFITHDLAAAYALADRVAVMDQGRLVEQGLARNVLTCPQHPVTQSLVAGRALWTP